MPPEAERTGPWEGRPDNHSPAQIVADEPAQQPYQLLPPLTPDEYAGLRADIEAHGIRVPVDVDEHGQVLDGHHRQRIAVELGIPCPVRVLAGLTEDDKRSHAVAVNAHRRALSRDQRRALVTAELERDPSRSDRAIGRLCGVDHKTVSAVRRGGWGIPQTEEFTPEQIAEFKALTERIRVGLAKGDAEVEALIAGGYVLDAVRLLTQARDILIATGDSTDPGWHACIRAIFEPRIRAVLEAGA